MQEFRLSSGTLSTCGCKVHIFIILYINDTLLCFVSINLLLVLSTCCWNTWKERKCRKLKCQCRRPVWHGAAHFFVASVPFWLSISWICIVTISCVSKTANAVLNSAHNVRRQIQVSCLDLFHQKMSHMMQTVPLRCCYTTELHNSVSTPILSDHMTLIFKLKLWCGHLTVSTQTP